MSRELPWEEPFSVLLGQLVTHQGGKRSDSDEYGSGRAYGGAALLVYPVYSGERNDLPFTVQISGFPIYRPERFELHGAGEYLRIHIARSLACNLEIHNRELLNRRLLAGRTDDEFTTGNPESNASYYLEGRLSSDRKLVRHKKCRNLIASLEPFVVLALTPTGTYWAQEIIDPIQLNLTAVEKYIQSLTNLVETLSG